MSSDLDYPYYDGTPPHVADSDTSLAAAEAIKESAGAIRRKIWEHVLSFGANGLTCDDVEHGLGIVHTTTSARIRELQQDGRLIKTARKRLTRQKRYARVYVGTLHPIPLDEDAPYTATERLLFAKVAELEEQNELLRERVQDLESQLANTSQPTLIKYEALDL